MSPAIDSKAFHQFSYGVFLLSARDGDVDGACIVNTAIQAASEPRQVSVCCIKGTRTQEMIGRTGRFCVSVLTEDAPKPLFEHFGMKSGHDFDKFADGAAEAAGANLARTEGGLLFEQGANAFFDCRVVSSTDMGSHILYVGEVVQAARLSDAPSITYDYYRTVTRKQGSPRTVQAVAGTSAAAATSASATAEPASAPVAWKCAICGYIYEGETLPDDFICPICKHGAEDFEPVFADASGSGDRKPEGEAREDEKKENETMAATKWVCKVCGYIYEGEQPPAECPVCHAPASQFKQVEGELELAAEHEYGIYDKTVRDNPDISDEDKAYILEQLKANFTGECSEVGMYLCMARIAHREGYPEVGLYWEKAAYEEAEHAAKFAELLGTELEPNMKATTKDNLAWRVDCEFGATAGKVELATCAKKNGLDAIHDTVHEMARDEARHGKALKGLLERYFG